MATKNTHACHCTSESAELTVVKRFAFTCATFLSGGGRCQDAKASVCAWAMEADGNSTRAGLVFSARARWLTKAERIMAGLTLQAACGTAAGASHGQTTARPKGVDTDTWCGAAAAAVLSPIPLQGRQAGRTNETIYALFRAPGQSAHPSLYSAPESRRCQLGQLLLQSKRRRTQIAVLRAV